MMGNDKNGRRGATIEKGPIQDVTIALQSSCATGPNPEPLPDGGGAGDRPPEGTQRVAFSAEVAAQLCRTVTEEKPADSRASFSCSTVKGVS